MSFQYTLTRVAKIAPLKISSCGQLITKICGPYVVTRSTYLRDTYICVVYGKAYSESHADTCYDETALKVLKIH